MPPHNRIDRREFVKWMSLGGAVSLAGCTGNDTDSENPTSNTDTSGNSDANQDSTTEKTESDSTTKNMHVQLGVGGSPEDLNPPMTGSAEGWIVTNWMYSNLTRTDSNLEVHPDLATDWEASDDVTSFTFQLREDATFKHNGKQVEAKDVKASIETIYDDDVGSGGNGTLGPITGVDVVDKTTARVNLDYPYSDLPKKLSKKWARIVPKDVIENEWDALSSKDYGSGPFALEEFEIGDHVTLSANEDYYMTDENGEQLPYVDKVTMQVYPEPVTRINSLQNQSTDITYKVPPEQWSRVQNLQGVKPIRQPGAWFFPVAMQVDKEPFSDNKVRQAFKYAIDSKSMLQGASSGLGTIAKQNPISPAHQFYNDLPNKYGPGAQPEKAKQLLSEAGYDDGLDLEHSLVVASSHASQMGKTAVLVQDQLESIGVNFDIQEVTWSTYVSDHFGQSPFTIGSYSMRMVEDGILYLLWHSEGDWNATTNFNDGEFDDALDAARRTTDTDEKRKQYAKCQKILQERGPHLVPFFVDILAAQRDYVENYEIDPTQTTVPLENVTLPADK